MHFTLLLCWVIQSFLSSCKNDYRDCIYQENIKNSSGAGTRPSTLVNHETEMGRSSNLSGTRLNRISENESRKRIWYPCYIGLNVLNMTNNFKHIVQSHHNFRSFVFLHYLSLFIIFWTDILFLFSFAYRSLVSAVDPVATIAIFKALNVDPTLNMLVFGESILNDAVSIVLTR